MILAFALALVQYASTGDESAWSKAAVVLEDSRPVVRFQARIDGDYLLVRARHEEGWHSYAMDNETRGTKALKGRASLGIEQGVEIKVRGGLVLDNHWRQTRPLDLSKPEIRWYTYGFEQTAIFACRVKTVTSKPIVLHIGGQACSGETCRKIDVVLELDGHQAVEEPTPEQAARLKALLKDLVPVTTQPADPADVQ
jgi:hypothetical protein